MKIWIIVCLLGVLMIITAYEAHRDNPGLQQPVIDNN